MNSDLPISILRLNLPNITPERKDEAFAERDRELIHLGKITTLLEPERKAVEAKDPMTA